MSGGRVFLGLGSSLGDRHDHIDGAIRALAGLPEFDLLRVASRYETRALGACEGPPFVNTVVCGLWSSTPEDLLSVCHDIERAHGRRRPHRDAPRTLDIDILFWEGHTRSTPTLEIPHPRLLDRAFALVPLLELDPRLCHPLTGLPLAACLTPELLTQGITDMCAEMVRA